ncbi:tyrosine-type recombinase/integrase [Brevibacillus laterosporus]|uniref:tyrosine-type recombinase/integrase n=1 Tax=Brevibacillus laterosporus TaxID=1465 RepID=UPI003D2384F9
MSKQSIQDYTKVVGFHTPTVHKAILSILKERRGASKNTATSYQQHIEQFFGYTRRKKLSELHSDDLIVTRQEVVEYRDYLVNLTDKFGKKRYTNSSINTKIYAMKSLYDFLPYYKYQVDSSVFKLIPLKAKDSKPIGFLNWNEMQQIIRKVKEQRKGWEKSIILTLAAQTAIRKDALFNLERAGILLLNDVPIIKAYDKRGILDTKPIPIPIYNELMEFIKVHGEKERVFTIRSQATLNNTIAKACEELQISKDRKITFHSFKKGSVDTTQKVFKDVKITQQHANHANPSTTLNIYTDSIHDYKMMPSFLLGQEIDLSKLEEMTKEEIINVIQGLDMGIKAEIARKINK